MKQGDHEERGKSPPGSNIYLDSKIFFKFLILAITHVHNYQDNIILTIFSAIGNFNRQNSHISI